MSISCYSVSYALRAAVKSVVRDSTGREIREPIVSHNEPNKGNNITDLYTTLQAQLYKLTMSHSS